MLEPVLFALLVGGAAEGGTAVAAGTNAAAVVVGEVTLIVTRDEGVIGILPVQVFLDGHDAVYRVRDAHLERAPDVRAALAGHFEKVAMPPGTMCRGTLGLVACVDGATYFASIDEGEHFFTSGLPGGKVIADFWPRGDGVVVATDGHSAFVSRDHGLRFVAVPGPPPRQMDGGWIWNGDPDSPSVVARDPMKTVTVTREEARMVLARSWTAHAIALHDPALPSPPRPLDPLPPDAK